mgnify:CR=1 FL=1
MNYPVKITYDEMAQGYQLLVPDLPGCKSDAESVEKGLYKLRGAIENHLQILAEYGEQIPMAKSIDHYLHAGQNPHVIWAFIDIDIVPFLGKSHKINVTLPELLIKQIDDRVSKTPEYKTRSGFIANACTNELNKG